MSMATRAALAFGMLLITSTAQAQIPVGTKVGEPTPVGTGTYDSLGRRDPFVSLIASRRTPVVPRAAQGLGAFMLSDVTVTGISKNGNQMMAILQGADKQSYVAKVKDRIADAVIKAIDKEGVVFVDLPGPGYTGRLQETRKLLRPSTEVNR